MERPSRMAWLLRGVGALQLAALIAWWAWRWPAAPAQAVVGAFVIVALPSIVLAIEFVLLAIIARRDRAVPWPTASQLVRAWASETLHLFRAFYWRMPFAWRAHPDLLEPACAGRTGVVLIHGFVCNRGFWAPWLARLRAQGHAFVAVNLEPVFCPIDDVVGVVDAAVRRVAECTGRPPVLVCHSMGGLAARAWLRAARQPERVRHVITIGSPHHGTWLGRFGSTPNGRQMRLGSDWLAQLERDERLHVRPRWTCWWGNCDNIVFPVATATLPGADNRLVIGTPHVALAFHPQVMDATFAALSEEIPARRGEFFTGIDT